MAWLRYDRFLQFGAGVATAVFFSVSAYADVFRVYDLEWSGAAFGNGAHASGLATIDVTLFGANNPGNVNSGFPNIYVTSLSVTVTGAHTGNGTFGLADFQSFGWSTNGPPLDLTRELVGQSVAFGLWGSVGSSGDFNIFAGNPNAPSGFSQFVLATFGGRGDHLMLTSFAPVSETPLPATLPLFASGLGVVGLLGRRKKRRATTASN